MHANALIQSLRAIRVTTLVYGSLFVCLVVQLVITTVIIVVAQPYEQRFYLIKGTKLYATWTLFNVI